MRLSISLDLRGHMTAMLLKKQTIEAEKNLIILSLNGTILQLLHSVCYLHNYCAF